MTENNRTHSRRPSQQTRRPVRRPSATRSTNSEIAYNKPAPKRPGLLKSTNTASSPKKRVQTSRRSPATHTSTTRTRSHGHAGGKPTKRRPAHNQRRQHAPSRPRNTTPKTKASTQKAVPALKAGVLRIIPLGGVEEIGRNMTAIEYGNDIVVVDCGFMFEDPNLPGIDFILPNTEYLEKNKHKVRALLVTHGHLDHIGAIPYIMPMIGNPPIYTRTLTSLIIQKRQEEFPFLPKLDIREVETEQTIKISDDISFSGFGVTHTFPDALGLIVKTPVGNVVVTGDIKLDHVDGVVSKEEIKSFSVFKKEQPLLLLMDSTSVWKQGWSVPEKEVFQTFEKILSRKIRGRLIIGTFASQMERLAKLIQIAEKNGKKVILEGRSMVTNLAIAEKVGLLKPKPGTMISIKEMKDYPPSKIVILATGAQGDQYAALMRMSNKSHKFVTLNSDDTIVLSASVIPGNGKAVQKLKDNLARQGSHIITYDTGEGNVHASGHGNAEEAKWIHKQINPKFFVPHHGHHFMLRVHKDLMKESIGMKDENIIIPDNGSIIEVRDNKLVKLKETAPSHTRVVEGQIVSDVQTAVIKDRQLLSQDGIFVIVATINKRTGKLQKSPDIISRGFVYLRDSQELLHQARLIIRKEVENKTKKSFKIDNDSIKEAISKSIMKFLLQQTNKRPIVIPVIVQV